MNNELQKVIINLIEQSPQSEVTITKSIAPKGEYLEYILNVIPNAFAELKKQGLVVPSHNAVYDCGPGNGLAVEWFYKLNK